LEETSNESYGDTLAVVTKCLKETMELEALVSNINHVARQEERRIQRPILVKFTLFVRKLEELKNDRFKD
jgi:hypothetical protein